MQEMENTEGQNRNAEDGPWDHSGFGNLGDESPWRTVRSTEAFAAVRCEPKLFAHAGYYCDQTQVTVAWQPELDLPPIPSLK